MLDKNKYLNLLKEKKYVEIIRLFKIDYINLFIFLLIQKNIDYEKDNSFYYYLNAVKKYYPEISEKLNYISFKINDSDIKSEEKINILIDMYIYIKNTYKAQKKEP